MVMDDGPRAGTTEVSLPPATVAACRYLPDLERWIATYFGTDPVTFIDVIGDQEFPHYLMTFTDQANELSFRPTGSVTFEADDRGDTATLVWVSETNKGTTFDSVGNKLGSVDVGRAELTIECGSIFR
jgi:hypothetical protein